MMTLFVGKWEYSDSRVVPVAVTNNAAFTAALLKHIAEWNVEIDLYTPEFKSDGTWVEGEGESVSTGTYTYSNGVLTIVNDDNETTVTNIVLSGNSLVIEKDFTSEYTRQDMIDRVIQESNLVDIDPTTIKVTNVKLVITLIRK